MLQMKKKRRTRTSQFRGVTRAGARWRAAIRINNIKRELGIFDSEAEAARSVLGTLAHRCTGLLLRSTNARHERDALRGSEAFICLIAATPSVMEL